MKEQYCCPDQAEAMPAPSSEGDGVTIGLTLIEILTQLATYKWLILSVNVSAILLGLLYGLTLPPQYTSVTTIMPPKQTQSTTSLLNSQLGAGGWADAASGGFDAQRPQRHLYRPAAIPADCRRDHRQVFNG